jgi:voltage-gated potassium channel
MIPYRRFAWPALAFLAVTVIGTLGYAILADPEVSAFDCFYMTFITITTIGYGEVVDLTGNVVGRVFTVFIALSGFGILTYFLSTITAFIVEGELTESFWRRKMEKKAANLEHHFIVCGAKGVGNHIINELSSTNRPFVIIDIDRQNVLHVLGSLDDVILIEGDATDDEILLRAGVKKAQGVFASTGEDHQDLVISLTAKRLNPSLRIVTSCKSLKNTEKMRTAGADAIVSPSFIGGLRMASEMVRPTVVTFLDTMLRDTERGLRIEDTEVPPNLLGRSLSDLDLQKLPHVLVLAIKKVDENWVYNPPRSYELIPGDHLVFMAPPDQRAELEKHLRSLT